MEPQKLKRHFSDFCLYCGAFMFLLGVFYQILLSLTALDSFLMYGRYNLIAAYGAFACVGGVAVVVALKGYLCGVLERMIPHLEDDDEDE